MWYATVCLVVLFINSVFNCIMCSATAKNGLKLNTYLLYTNHGTFYPYASKLDISGRIQIWIPFWITSADDITNRNPQIFFYVARKNSNKIFSTGKHKICWNFVLSAAAQLVKHTYGYISEQTVFNRFELK